MEQSETAEKLVKLLKKKNLTVTTAESCTGGTPARLTFASSRC